MPQVAVTINGKSYRMACDEGQESHLIGLAQQLDGYVGHLKDSFGEIGDQRLTIMAGIMVIDELTELKKKMQKLETDGEDLRTGMDDIASANAEREKTVLGGLDEAAERLEKMARKLNGL
jgi:cell division protein ZapA